MRFSSLLLIVSLAATESLAVFSSAQIFISHPVGHQRSGNLLLSADDGVVKELEARLGRQLTPIELVLAREAVDGVINRLEARLNRHAPRRLETPEQAEIDQGFGAVTGSKDLGEQQCVNSASAVASNWGSWRNQAPANVTARARHILVDSEAVALSLLKQLIFGADIGQLAMEHSMCPSKDTGGDLGVFAPCGMAEEFSRFVFDESTPTGTPVGPVSTPFGYHIVIVDERTTRSTL